MKQTLDYSLLSIDQAVDYLKQGEIIAYPTEGVYGLGCDPDNQHALKKLLQVKQRSNAKGFILIASTVDQLEKYIDFSDVSIEILDKIKQSWPGFVTWLVSVNRNNINKINKILYGSSFDNNNISPILAVRVTNHPVVTALCNKFGGAIVSTSANISGQNAILDRDILNKQFGNKISGIVSGELGGYNKPSMIIDSRNGNIIR
jgi:L-threonylcarbamoyladenylate synthase